ncbi:hypothetical protein WJX79_006770 [Trebouxia sp. C0005]
MTGAAGTGAVGTGAVGTRATLVPALLLLAWFSAYTAVAQSPPPPPPIVPSGGYNGFIEQMYWNVSSPVDTEGKLAGFPNYASLTPNYTFLIPNLTSTKMPGFWSMNVSTVRV